MTKITATFIDEISHDIPHQNWGATEWAADFAHMQHMGITTVVIIRCGYRKQLTYDSPYLLSQGCIAPSTDVVAMLLPLAHQHNMKLYIGLYDSGNYWDTGNMQHEVTPNLQVIPELWKRYGHYPAFGGWYLPMEISRKTRGATEAFVQLGNLCKQVSNNLPVLISPWIDGVKAVSAAGTALTKTNAVTLTEHEAEWNEIFSAIHKSIDVVAFQDGHVPLHELQQYLAVNKKLADAYGLTTWTNSESFDRDMPIKFLPIKYDKLRYKLQAAANVGIGTAITFEFSHFMSPQSMYPSAGHLYNRYIEGLSQK